MALPATSLRRREGAVFDQVGGMGELSELGRPSATRLRKRSDCAVMRARLEAVRSDAQWRRPGLTIFLWGFAVWSITTAITAVTNDPILIPTVLLTGTFVIPIAVVVSLLHREETQVGSPLSPRVMIEGFLGGGTVGLVLSALLEGYLMPSRTGTYVVVGLIEETCKGLLIVVAARRRQRRTPLDGMVLGAIVGAGFGAFESAGYAFNSYIKYGTTHPFGSLLQSELNRALVPPFGHIAWSSILGGALFAAASDRVRFRVTPHLFGVFLGVVALHSLWDEAYGWAIIMARASTGAGWDLGWPDGASWLDSPTTFQHQLFTAFYNVLLLVIGAAGALWFIRLWRRHSAGALASRAPAFPSRRLSQAARLSRKGPRSRARGGWIPAPRRS
jgi:RsiW-degrading membrane proteinase PrsW (M82 family)